MLTAGRSGPGLAAGAVLHGAALLAFAAAGAPRALGAQTPAPGDSARRGRDTSTVRVPARADTVPADRDSASRRSNVRADSLKRPLARAESPTAIDPSTYWRWDRAAIFASGAVDLLDLLDRVPGLTGFRTAWVGSAGAAAFLGDGRRVRLFYDGIELDALDPRTGGVVDPITAQLWTLEDVTIERSAGEVRVFMRSWRVERTTPSTRVDVSTGDIATNTFRGFFGRRFTGGEAVQAGFHQFSSSRFRYGGDNDALEIVARLGVARGRWKGDAFVNRARRTRDDIFRIDPRTLQRVDASLAEPLPGEEATYTTAYVRGGYGDPGAGLWAQVTAASLGFKESTGRRAASTGVRADTADTNRSRAQYVVAGGVTRGGLALSATGRLRVFEGYLSKSAAARASLARGPLSSTLLVERTSLDQAWRGEAIARLAPFDRVAISGAVSQFRYDGNALIGPTEATTRLDVRAEAAVRLGQLWLGGGVIARDSANLLGLRAFDDSAAAVADARTTGVIGTARGRLFRAVHVDAYGISWDQRGANRPKYQTRAQVYLQTSLPRRFPSGNFGLLTSVVHEYRSATPFVAADRVLFAGQAQSLSGLLEIRIVNAVLSYQIRNAFNIRNQYVPLFQAPPATSVYGVRWEFVN